MECDEDSDPPRKKMKPPQPPHPVCVAPHSSIHPFLSFKMPSRDFVSFCSELQSKMDAPTVFIDCNMEIAVLLDWMKIWSQAWNAKNPNKPITAGGWATHRIDSRFPSKFGFSLSVQHAPFEASQCQHFTQDELCNMSPIWRGQNLQQSLNQTIQEVNGVLQA